MSDPTGVPLLASAPKKQGQSRRPVPQRSRLPLSDKRGHEAVPASHAHANTNVGLRPAPGRATESARNRPSASTYAQVRRMHRFAAAEAAPERQRRDQTRVGDKGEVAPAVLTAIVAV